jgi:hypothetical protein
MKVLLLAATTAINNFRVLPNYLMFFIGARSHQLAAKQDFVSREKRTT